MVTQDMAQERTEKREKTERDNLLLKMGLGDLEREKDKLVFKLGKYAFYPNTTQIPASYVRDYTSYQKVIDELNRRGREYRDVPEPHLDSIKF